MSTESPRRGRPRQHSDAALLDAARASFASDGFANVSMDTVAAAAGTTKATLYARFAGKEALYQATLQREIDALLEQLFSVYADIQDLAAADMVAPGMRAAFYHFATRPDALTLLAAPDGSPTGQHAAERITQAITDRLAGLIEIVFVRRGQTAPQSAHLMASAIVGLTVNLLRETQPPRNIDSNFACTIASELTKAAITGINPNLLTR